MEGGGAERAVQSLLSHCVERGDSEVVLLLLLENRITLEIPAGIPVLARRRCARSGIGKILMFVPQAVWIRRIVRNERLTAVVSHLERSNLANGLSKALGSPHRVVLVEHTNPSRNYKGRGFGPRVMRWLIRRIYPLADVVLAVSEGVKQSLVDDFRIPATSVAVAYDPCDLRRVRALALEPADMPWPDDDTPVVCTVGRLVVPKGHVHLLRAFARLRAAISVRLVLVGAGPLERELREQAADLGICDSVAFLGWQDNPCKYLARSTLFAFSSLWEGFGIALVEALACGVPVVAFDCKSGPREILQGGECGVLVAVGDEAALAEAMRALLLDEPRRRGLAALGRERAATFDVPAVFNVYKRAWQDDPQDAIQTPGLEGNAGRS
jgi:glycosyltransferase involved in cell wall biosynthesis